MDRKKKLQQNKRNWVAAKRLATSIGVHTNNATYTESDNDSNDSLDKCPNLSKASGSGQDVFVDLLSHASTRSGEGGDDETWNMIDENPIVSSDSLSSDGEGNIANDLVSWINKHQIKHNAADDLLKLLKAHGNSTLLLSARTLLKTERFDTFTRDNSPVSQRTKCINTQDGKRKCMSGMFNQVLCI